MAILFRRCYQSGKMQTLAPSKNKITAVIYTSFSINILFPDASGVKRSTAYDLEHFPVLTFK